MPHLDGMAKELPKIKFVGIGIDNVQNISQFVAKIPVSYQLLIAGYGGIALVRLVLCQQINLSCLIFRPLVSHATPSCSLL